MKRALSLGLVAILCHLSIACTKGTASRVKRQQRLAIALEKQGMPDASWDEARLQRYEFDLNRVARLDRDGSYSTKIAERRTALMNARAQRGSTTTSTHDPRFKADFNDYQTLVQDHTNPSAQTEDAGEED